MGYSAAIRAKTAGRRMLRKVLFQTHWFVGITLGLVLSMLGITGALMAFDREISDALLGAHRELPATSALLLDNSSLYERLHAANPQRVLLAWRPAPDARHPAAVQFAAAVDSVLGGASLGNDDDRKERRLVDPTTGSLLTESRMSRGFQDFEAWLRQIHQGHWWPPGHPVGNIVYNSIGIAAVFLFLMALSGLYMRWPRGHARRSWRAWFGINSGLKGRAFLFNLHSVLGTIVLIAYLISAHSGAFQNGTVSWYGAGVRALVGAPQLEPQGPPPEPGAVPPAPPVVDDSAVWRAFLAAVPRFAGVTASIARAPITAAAFDYESSETSQHGRVEIDTATGSVRRFEPGAVPSRTVVQWVLERNQDLHEGRVFGRVGTAIMASAALCLPVFYITGWMMYLKRRAQRKKRVAGVVLQRSP